MYGEYSPEYLNWSSPSKKIIIRALDKKSARILCAIIYLLHQVNKMNNVINFITQEELEEREMPGSTKKKPVDPVSLLAETPDRLGKEYMLQNGYSEEYVQAEEQYYSKVRPFVFVPLFGKYIAVFADGTVSFPSPLRFV